MKRTFSITLYWSPASHPPYDRGPSKCGQRDDVLRRGHAPAGHGAYVCYFARAAPTGEKSANASLRFNAVKGPLPWIQMTLCLSGFAGVNAYNYGNPTQAGVIATAWDSRPNEVH
jgi:hypothetical protein